MSTTKDPYNNLLVKETCAIALRTNGTLNGAAVDRNEDASMFQAALVVVHTGTITDGTHTVEVQHSDDNAVWAAVADADLQGSEPAIVAADDNKIYEIGYRGLKRYLRVVVVTAGAATGGTFGASVILADPRVVPVIRN